MQFHQILILFKTLFSGKSNIGIYVVLFLLISLYVYVLSYFSILRHNAFASGFDLGNMNQTVWNTAYGKFFTLTTQTGNMSRLSIHADYVLILLAPFYWLWNNVRVLLIAESVFFGMAALPVFLIARHILQNKYIALCFSILYLVNPGILWANIYDFHSVSFALPMILFAFYFVLQKQWKWYWVFAVLAMLAKENISLTISAIGFVIYFYTGDKKQSMLSVVVGLLYFFVTVFIIMPLFSPEGHHWALSWFKHAEQSSTTQYIPPPEFVVNRLFYDSLTKEYIYMLMREWGFLPLLGFPLLILSIPDLVINIFSAQGQMRSIYFHYDVIISAGMIVSSIFGIYFMRKFVLYITKSHMYAQIASYSVMFVGMVIGLHFAYYYAPLPIAPGCLCYIYNVTEEDRKFSALLRTIPRTASVTASPEIRPHVTRREVSYTLPVATDSADFIAIIDQNRMVGNYEPKDFELRLVEILDREDKYTRVEKLGHFYLYKRNK